MQTRIVTGVFAGALFLAMLWLGGYWYAGLISLLAIIGYDEYLRLNGLKRNEWMMVAGFVGMALIISPALDFAVDWFTTDVLVWFLMFVLLAITVFSKNRVTLDHAALVFIGAVYLGFGFRWMIGTRLVEPDGLFWTLLVFLCIWGTDSGAYFTGKWVGRTKLWPAISPNKTVEGALGGVLIAVVIAIGFHLYRPELLTVGHAILLGVVIAVVGQIGDLIQSAYKRIRNVKDSGTLLPGHGGVLDRTDSWLIVFPLVNLIGLIPH